MLLCDYVNSFNFFRNGELPKNQIGKSGLQVKKENEKDHRFAALSLPPPSSLPSSLVIYLLINGRITSLFFHGMFAEEVFCIH